MSDQPIRIDRVTARIREEVNGFIELFGEDAVDRLFLELTFAQGDELTEDDIVAAAWEVVVLDTGAGLLQAWRQGQAALTWSTEKRELGFRPLPTDGWQP